jgi:hypothetical protein
MKRYAAIISSIVICFSLSACGGGGSNGGGSSGAPLGTVPSTTQASATVMVTKPVLQLSESTLVSAVFISSTGKPAAGITVEFSATLGTINPANGISTTDANGVATAQLVAGSNAGQGQITAVATVENKQVSSSTTYSVNLPPLTLSVPKLDLSPISYGGSTTVSVQVKDVNGNPYISQPVDVKFTSAQAALGKASITPTARAVNGTASATYIALTNTGIDTITVSIAGDSKTVDVTVLPLNAGSISFVSASPTTIVLKGGAAPGLSETSDVVFKVLDTVGLPKASQPVDFTLTTSAGGLAVLPTSASSDANGFVSTTVQAGTVSTSFRVIATVRNTAIASQSAQMVVSTGVPKNISTSFGTLASESFDYDGIIVPVTARLSDSMQNPVQDNTAVYFTTDAGAIGPSCFTVNGACSVNWTSQAPRSSNGIITIISSAVGANGFVSQTKTIVSASSRPKDSSFELWNTAHAPQDKIITPATPAVVGPPAVPLIPQSSVLDLTVEDTNGNTMPSGTTISVSSSTAGLTFQPTSFSVPDTVTTGLVSGITTFKVGVSNANITGGSGSITVTVTTPKQVTTPKTFNFTW